MLDSREVWKILIYNWLTTRYSRYIQKMML